MRIEQVMEWMSQLAPLELSEDWDNTGLLLGDRHGHVARVLTCLTLTPESVEEALARQVDLVIAHHPLPFRPLASITTDTASGRLLWQLATQGVAVYAPHTAWDSAEYGINAQLAAQLQLRDCQPLLPNTNLAERGLGAGRVGRLPAAGTLVSIAELLSQSLEGCRPRGVVGTRPIQRVAIACGSGGSLLPAAVDAGCDLFLTGEATFHTCLEAQAAGVALLMVGHFASEKFAMNWLAEELAEALGLEVYPSQRERDPVANL